MLKIIFLSLIITIFNTPFAVSQETKESPYDKVPTKLWGKNLIVIDSDYESFMFNRLQPFKLMHKKDKTKLVRSDIKDKINTEIDNLRTSKYYEIFIHDMNFDGIISKEDLDESLRLEYLALPMSDQQRRRDNKRKKIMEADLNNDGEISLKEASTIDEEYKNKKIEDIKNRLEPYFEYGDLNNDDIVTLDEMKELASNTFKILDLDGNSVISIEEFHAYREYTK
ncbi:MAG: hypothetical protein AB7U85_10220 [Alphaproteobacteria bacterium]